MSDWNTLDTVPLDEEVECEVIDTDGTQWNAMFWRGEWWVEIESPGLGHRAARDIDVEVTKWREIT